MSMATDLPSRPAPDPDADDHRIVSATDRVKSVADKTDPRFEAALQRTEREARLRAEREAKADGEASDEPDDADDDAQPDVSPDAPGSFSFNMTAGDAEPDQ